MKCKLCGEEKKKLRKSHILPKWCYKDIQKDDPFLYALSKNNKFPKKIRMGIYDKKLLCSTCEDKFNKIDDEAYKIFCETPSISTDPRYIQLPEDVKPRAMLFMQSVLLRASLSTMPAFKAIQLDEYTDDFHQAVIRDQPAQFTDAIIFKMIRPEPFEGGLIFSPVQNIIENNIHCFLSFAGYLGYVDIGFPPSLPHNSLNLKSPGVLTIGFHDYFPFELNAMEELRKHILTHRK